MNSKLLQIRLKDFYWCIPFISFLIGYQLLNLFFKTHAIETPHIVGKTLQESLAVLSPAKLNTRLVAQKEDADIKEGTILNQMPVAGQRIKPHQTVFVVASKHPVRKKAPQVQGQMLANIKAMLKEKKIRYKVFFLEVAQPEGLCITQIPKSGTPLPKEGMTLYCAIDTNAQVLFPKLEGTTVEDTLRFLEEYGITPRIFHINQVSERHECSRCIVKEQKPLPGSLVNLKDPLSVQLKV